MPSIRGRVVDSFLENLEAHQGGNVSVDTRWESLCTSMADSVKVNLPNQLSKANKPWIREETLDLIRQRLQARAVGDWELEKHLNKHIKKSAKKDRSIWLEELAGTGDWQALRRLKQGRKAVQTRLCDETGNTVSTEQRADVFAQHLETIQWRVRPVTLLPGVEPPLHTELEVELGPFCHVELRKAIRKLKNGKATRQGDISIEIIKALAEEAGQALSLFLGLFNTCLATQCFPEEWVLSRVVMIFKKKDPALCDNYRLISVLSIAYKIFASMLKQRLLDAGLDARLSQLDSEKRGARRTQSL